MIDTYDIKFGDALLSRTLRGVIQIVVYEDTRHNRTNPKADLMDVLELRGPSLLNRRGIIKNLGQHGYDIEVIKEKFAEYFVWEYMKI